jgi:hypothetical protein
MGQFGNVGRHSRVGRESVYEWSVSSVGKLSTMGEFGIMGFLCFVGKHGHDRLQRTVGFLCSVGINY